jgi:hypothetical protein
VPCLPRPSKSIDLPSRACISTITIWSILGVALPGLAPETLTIREMENLWGLHTMGNPPGHSSLASSRFRLPPTRPNHPGLSHAIILTGAKHFPLQGLCRSLSPLPCPLGF